MLEKMRNIKFLQKINTEPYKAKACSLEPDDFANFLEKIFASEKERSFLTNPALIQIILEFSDEELNIVLNYLPNLRACDDDDNVVELFKYSSSTFRDELFQCFNRILKYSRIEESWHSILSH